VEKIKEELLDIDENVLFADGFDEAIIGYVEIYNKTIALYDRNKCLDIIIKQFGEEEAESYMESAINSYVGEYTPAFATFLK
jgi:hypothetical protein